MTRRLIALIAVTTLVFAMLPGGLAAASASASANLAAENRDVFPGNGQGFSLTVDNNETSGLLGIGSGPSIDWIRIILPASRGFRLGDGPIDFDGWDVTETRTSSSQSLTLRNGSLSAGSSETFDFPVTVLRPENRDLPGPFQVMVSSNGGQSSLEAEGNLISLVRILEILDGTVGSPLLAADGSASGGQLVDYDVTVFNHALQAVDVETLVTPRDGDEVTNPAPVASVPAGDDRTFTHEIQLAQVSSDRTNRFDVDAEKTDGLAVAATEQFTYLVQVPPLLRLDEGTFGPRFVQPHTTQDPPRDYRFSAAFEKENTPALSIQSGQLEFAGTVVDIDPARSRTEWNGEMDEIVTERTAVFGDDGDYDVTYSFDIVDGNGFAFTQLIDSNNDLITIDGIAPIIRNLLIEFPEDDDGAQQIRVKDNDRVEISGEVVDANPDPDGLTITLDISGADNITLGPDEISTSSTSDGLAFSAVVEREFGVATSADFTVAVQALDLAENSDGDTLDESPYVDGMPLQIDNVPVSVASQGTIVERSDLQGVSGTERVIEFVFEENFDTLGACNASLYAVDGELLTRGVYYADGSSCDSGQAAPDGVNSNIRVLRLFNQKDRGWEGNVNYRPSGTLGNRSDRAKDGAGWFSGQGVQEIIDRIKPPLPEILQVTRNNGEETAVFDEDRYWTRFTGNDAQLSITGAGVRAGDRLEVFVGNTRVSRSSAAQSSGEQLSATLPIAGGAADGTYTFRIRLMANVPGDFKTVLLELDRQAPSITGLEVLSDDEVEVQFDEKIWAGSNFASDWRAYEDDMGQLAEIGVRSVSEGDDNTTRRLEVARQNFGPIAGVEYLFESNSRYEDRAGNTLANQFQGI